MEGCAERTSSGRQSVVGVGCSALGVSTADERARAGSRRLTLRNLKLGGSVRVQVKDAEV